MGVPKTFINVGKCKGGGGVLGPVKIRERMFLGITFVVIETVGWGGKSPMRAKIGVGRLGARGGDY